jgi:hypothetical protein
MHIRSSQGHCSGPQLPRAGTFPARPQLLLDPGFPYGEDLLQFIWASRSFDQHALRTTDGLPLDVLQPGRIQGNSGPDLLDAQVRIGGQLWAGTVEVHLRSSEWNAHGHQFDPAYENVVLHVVYEHDAEVRTLSGKTLPTVELLPRISTQSIALHHSLMTSRSSVPCAPQLHRADPGRVGPWLERVLVERLERKTLHVEELYHRLGSDAAATLYHLLLQGFGMKVNADPFGMLAHALPLNTLLKYRDDPLRTEALLFGQAGLLQVDMVDDHPRWLQQEHRLLAHMLNLRPAPVAAWKFGRMRPVNFPTVRIAQFAQLFMRLDGDLGRLLREDDLAALRSSLDTAAVGYWQDHHVFDRPSKPAPKTFGRTAADHVIINAVVPVLFALGRLQGRQEQVERAMALLEQLPPETNTVLGTWSQLGLKAHNAARGQALLEQFTTYCAARRCLSCGIGNVLLKHSASA